MFKMDIPLIKPEGLTRNLQEQLNKKDKQSIEETKQYQRDKKESAKNLQIKKKFTYVDKKAKSITQSPEKIHKEPSPNKKQADILEDSDPEQTFKKDTLP